MSPSKTAICSPPPLAQEALVQNPVLNKQVTMVCPLCSYQGFFSSHDLKTKAASATA